MIKSGIYKILNKINGKFYIGSAINFKRRFARHARLLNTKEHPNEYLQNAWNKYWSISFEFIILQYVENKADLIKYEQVWLNFTRCYDREVGYNICKIADNRTGILHSAAAKIKMSEANKGRIKSPEWQAKITSALTGKKRDPSVGKAHSERMKGRDISEQTKINMAVGQAGRKHSQESKDKRSLALKGRKVGGMKEGYKHSEEAKKKQSEARIRYLAKLKEETANA